MLKPGELVDGAGEFQLLLHHSEPTRPDNKKSRVVLDTIRPEVEKRSRCRVFRKELEGEAGRYRIPVEPYHFLHAIDLEFTLPTIEVRPEHVGQIQIRLIHHATHNLNRSATLKYGTNILFQTETVVADDKLQHDIKKRKAYLSAIGETVRNRTWGKKIHGQKLYYPLKTFGFDFDEDNNFDKALILFKMNQELILHLSNFTNPLDAVECQVMIDGEWEPARVTDPKYFKISMPTISCRVVGIFGVTDVDGKEWLKNTSQTVVYHEVRVIRSTNGVKPGRSYQKFIPCRSATLAVGWLCQPMKSVQKNILSNYTTHWKDASLGEHPTRSMLLRGHYIVETEKLGTSWSADYISQSNALRYCRKAPLEKGYAMEVIGHRIYTNTASTGLFFEDDTALSLILELKKDHYDHSEVDELEEKMYSERSERGERAEVVERKGVDEILGIKTSETSVKKPTEPRDTDYMADRYNVYILIHQLCILTYQPYSGCTVYRDTTIGDLYKEYDVGKATRKVSE